MRRVHRGGFLGVAALVGCGGGGKAGETCAATCDATAGVESACAAIVDNAGAATFGLRVAQLTFTKPHALTEPLVAGLLTEATTPNLPDCQIAGTGAMSWLLQIDTAAARLTTGLAGPVGDPTEGYCFLDDGIARPATVDFAPSGGTWSTRGSLEVNLISDALPISLPLRGVSLSDVSLSADQSCVGSYRADDLDPALGCAPEDGSRYVNGGTLHAYITLEEADALMLADLQESLCVLLTGDAGDGQVPRRCSRSMLGTVSAAGDWCSITDTPGGCVDALEVSAAFAADRKSVV